MTQGPLPTPPELPGRAWRPLQPSDARAMRALDLSGSAPGGLAADPLQDYDNAFDDARTDPAGDTLAAVDERGALLAYGWVQAPRQLDSEYRVDLLWQAARAGGTAPGKPLAKRTVVATPAAIAADFLLDWMETRARQRCAELPDDGLPRRLALWCWADQRPRLSLYERHGYTERWAQQHMRRNLRRPRPAVPFPNGIKIVPWELEHDELMRQAYDSAFRDQRQRDDGGIDTADWQRLYTDVAEFCPEVSFIALHGDEPVGLTRCLLHKAEKEGEIGQLGVVPEWRRRRLGAALLAATLFGFVELGLRWATLSVDLHNKPAVKLFKHAGFTVTRRYVGFAKVIAPE